MQDDLISIPDAAIRLGMSYNQVTRLICLRVLKGERREGRWFVAPQSVDAYRATRTIPVAARTR